MNSTTSPSAHPRFGSQSVRRFAVSVLVAAAGAALLSGAVQPAWADQGRGMQGMPALMGGGHPEHLQRGVDRMLDAVNATEAQRAQIKQIVQAAATDLAQQREAGRALRERGRELFTASSVDANATEQLRQQMLAQHDQASRRMMNAMLDVSRVLTPEQRTQLAQQMKSRADGQHSRRHGQRPGSMPQQP